MDQLSRSHDGFFRKLLSEPRRARDYLNTFLPEHIKRVVDFDSLEQTTESYVDDKLKQSFSDVVFNANSKDGQGINFCFLFEHKSYIDKKATYQILHYISSAMLKRAENEEPQRLIIPILFYHGETPWAYKTISHQFEGIDEALQLYLPDFDYLYHNFQKKPDEEIITVKNPLLASAILAMKHYYDQGYLLANMRFFFIGSMDEQGNFYKPLAVYIFDKLRERTEEIQEAMSKVPTPQKTEAMSILDAYKLEGELEGKIKGENKKTRQACINMINHGFDNEVICQILEVEVDYVAALRTELKE